MKFRFIASALLLILPWRLRRVVLNRAFGFQIDKTARIGFSILLAREVRLDAGAYIGHLTFVGPLEKLALANDSRIGNLNWISAVPLWSMHYKDVDRAPDLILGRHSAITNRHFFDCTGGVRVGAFATFAGVRSQVLTHAIDFEHSVQRCASVLIGDYSFVGTASTVLAGATLPKFSVLAAGAVLAGAYEEEYALYGGVPAKKLKNISADVAYFRRSAGYVL